ncbi:unnamed protein product [Effrenium voratum]|uniref:Signal peptidase complex subunit 2 n=1 Tax=Effrenium voratum TaxID=2562239 RepID=A0AA36MQA6_9DINO|nr:unnamed protein product [Effrenium voratum]CAJ1375362.1 unnamed protein product [Effrenium voratum]|mmetsp:Transcript_100980/g.240642  ORF Transcript_100980/g.240642 Transcript_100980/m.240642 type:complete len:187 (+) Transcript_100980:39-599(+)|eukprot:CAMPEP_0181473020 /NCGR_PEP_ID=MMETSP1110-20121109/39907_1 /TAXON_ID=174948 /ORGANISM="Symbiodinium sp., Strain CCMP421" /LENGTH=186 /DNA_ID=CAMNT_0023598121 /DNA_START=36 /DNA_END=596 /DNA_ORIENTATION=+
MADNEFPEVEDKKAGSLYSKTDLVKVVSEFFNDAIPRMGFQEDHFWTNIRIMLCIICCSFGCYAQFGLKFPKDRIYIGICVAGYFLFTGLVQLIDMLVIKTSVICLKVNGKTVFVDVTMLPFSHEMEIGLRTEIGLKKQAVVSHKTSVGSYFDSDGYIGQEEILTEFLKLVDRFRSASSGKSTKGS